MNVGSQGAKVKVRAWRGFVTPAQEAPVVAVAVAVAERAGAGGENLDRGWKNHIRPCIQILVLIIYCLNKY